MKPLALLFSLLVLAALPATAGAAKTTYYLSLGDSLSQGVQPGPVVGANGTALSRVTNSGYSDQLYKKAKKLYPKLQLVKFGCPGATSGSFLNGGVGCNPPVALPYENTSSRDSQMQAARDFIADNKGAIQFITLDIGNNDLQVCASSTGIDVGCVSNGSNFIKQNLPVIAKNLRKAAGSKVPIIGATFYDPFLQQYLNGNAGIAQASAALAQSINDTIIEPAYAAQKIKVAQIDDAFGTYTPFDQTTQLADGQTVPVAVANICNLTWECAPKPAGPNIHANTAGYGVMADQFFTALKADS